MAKIIKLTPSQMENARKGFFEFLQKRKEEIEKELDEYSSSFDKTVAEKMSDGNLGLSKTIKLEYKKDLSKIDRRASLVFSKGAYIKMCALVATTDKEVAWHGVAERGEDDIYIVKDIIVYPQEVTAATIDRDRKEYEKWLAKLDDDTFNNLRFQGHSHVNMGTSPSGTDLEHQREILDQLFDEDFYIFFIMNKSMSMYAKIFDLKKNVVFEKEDIDVCIGGMKLGAFVKEAGGLVKTKTYTAAKKDTVNTASGVVTKDKPKQVSKFDEDYDDYPYGSWYRGYYGGRYYD